MPDGFFGNHNRANIERVSARISLGVLFYIAKTFSSHFLLSAGVEPVTPLKYGPGFMDDAVVSQGCSTSPPS